MTVIATIITRHCTAHACDSFLTSGGAPVETQATKIVRVPHYRGAISFWGLAEGPGWNTLKWLRNRVGRASEAGSAEAFAHQLAQDLGKAIWSLPIPLGDRGLGIQFSAYERVGDYWVPEMFAIRSYLDAERYTTVRPDGFEVTRETYATVAADFTRDQRDGTANRRMFVHQKLHEAPLMLRYQNGDPELFNRIANALLESFIALGARGAISPDELASPATHRNIVRRPIELVSQMHADFVKAGRRLIGGKPHDLSITPGGEYGSSTGD